MLVHHVVGFPIDCASARFCSTDVLHILSQLAQTFYLYASPSWPAQSSGCPSRSRGLLHGGPLHCKLVRRQILGADTSLITYMWSGSIDSNEFMSRDSESTNGHLLVARGSEKRSRRRGPDVYHRGARVRVIIPPRCSSSSDCLFTFKIDLVLLVGASADLRGVLVFGQESEEHRVPQGRG